MLQINEELKFVDIVNKHTDKKSIEGLTVGEYLLLDIIGKSGGALSENSIESWFSKSALSYMEIPTQTDLPEFSQPYGLPGSRCNKKH